MSTSVTTMVRDASHRGGGIVNVARPLHDVMTELGTNTHFVSGNQPETVAANQHVVGMGGAGLIDLPTNAIGSVVHIHGIWTAFEYRAFRTARERKARIVISPHGALEPWALRHKRIKKQIAWRLYQKSMMQRADLLIVNSLQERASLRQLGLTGPIATIANGVSIEGLSQYATPKERTVLFFSRLDPKKGVPDLIDAWARLGNRKGYTLHIQGHGEDAYVRSLAERIRQHGLGEHIRILPPVFGQNRWTAYQTASIFVLPSYSENFGITVAEALMAGLPVITTASTPWGDLPSEGLGWIVGNDIGQLTNALQTAIDLTEAQLTEVRGKAIAYAQARFRWDAIAEVYLKTYAFLLGPSTSTPPWIDVVRG
ncbi:glycosyltransferase [Hyphomicrobium sp. NDB2Meth4]|uniref:glycosyltransferase n=1 Tax=Hyphomicrobium sp. NDB2Meth4 TaxID=1892846 RepID=UPI000A5E02DF|nr:glycosyltransferase [Hyphomicrobium sp. NDB2Meth4]